MRTYYEVLGISEDATQASIRSMYHRLLQIYHPDHNDDPYASKVCQQIIEAYSILGDSLKRADYDRNKDLHASAAEESRRPARQPQPDPPPKPVNVRPEPPLKEVVCERCGIQDETLRSFSMVWVVSLLVTIRRGRKGGIWCARCRTRQAWMYSSVAGLAGWWGLPSGPRYTASALWENAHGGRQEKRQNASLLRLVGYQLYQKERYAESYRTLNATLLLEWDQAAEHFRDSILIPCLAKPPGRGGTWIWDWLTVAPSLLFTALAILIVSACFIRVSDYSSSYQPTRAGESAFDQSTPSQAKLFKTHQAAEKLATAIEANATPVGSHQEGSSLINEYQLDRSKYEASTFENIADEVEPLLRNAKADATGEIVSTYFNAKLMAQSISILNGFDSGSDVSDSIEEVKSLGANERIRTWLASSAYATSYQSLVESLDALSQAPPVPTSPSIEAVHLKSLKQELDIVKAQIRAARATGMRLADADLVKQYNASLDEYDTVEKRQTESRAQYEKVEFAFNRCLDPALLISRPERAKLVTSQQAIESGETDRTMKQPDAVTAKP